MKLQSIVQGCDEMDLIRIGRISAIDYKNGMASVVYADRDNMVTPFFPMLANEYSMPKVRDLVAVLHLPRSNQGVILGRIWNGTNKPPEGKKGIYRKDFDRNGTAFVKYNEKTGELIIQAKKITKKEASDSE